MNDQRQPLIVLGGFMGTGKSTVGRLVADRLAWAFIDTDAEIEARARRTIADIFARSGEAAFRQMEFDVCLELARQEQLVISVGGGALLNSRVYEAFAASSLLICLTCALDEIIRRVGDDPARPLFAPDPARLGALLASRTDHYARFPIQLDTTHLSPAQVAQKVIDQWSN